jgi:hypothetical protein
MVRTQIQLTEKQARELRRQAGLRRMSVAALIRGHIDRGLQLERNDLAAKYGRAARVVGKFKAKLGLSDASVNHDRYLNESGRW